MASPRSTPFIASWDVDASQDVTVPLEDILEARPRAVVRSQVASPSRALPWLAGLFIGLAGVLAAAAVLVADRRGPSPVGSATSKVTDVSPVARPRTALPVLRTELQPVEARVDVTTPDIAFLRPTAPTPSTRIARSRPQPAALPRRPGRDELAAALLERRRQMTELGLAQTRVDAVSGISFDPSRRSARVVYRAAGSDTPVVEYWALRDGHWQPLGN